MLLTNPVGLLMPTPLHLLALLVVLCILSFRRHSRMRHWRFVLLAGVAWCWVLSTPAIAHRLTLQLERQYAPLTATVNGSPLILVLASGDAYENSQPDPLQLDLASFRRTQVAVSLWRETGGILLFAGTIHRHEQRPVAARMAELARSSGVPAAHIRVETRSRSTRENLLNNLAILEPARQVILVTSAAHMPRAMAVAHALGLDPLAAPADFRAKRALTWRAWLPNSQSLPLLSFALREWTGRLYYALRGWT